MAKVNDFRDFDAFKASRSFVREIGQLVRTPSFAPNRNLVNQMERAAISRWKFGIHSVCERFQRVGGRATGTIDLFPRHRLDSGIKIRRARQNGHFGGPALGWPKPLSERIRKTRSKI
jgi:hypothetical protein